jgi:alcohol dehydrogenase class IV
VPEYQVAYVLNRQEQLTRTSTTEEGAETANPYPDSLSEQVFALLTEYVRLARHRDLKVNMHRLCNLGEAAAGIGFFSYIKKLNACYKVESCI